MNLLISWSTVAFTVSTIAYFLLLIPVITSHSSVTCAIFSLFDVELGFFLFCFSGSKGIRSKTSETHLYLLLVDYIPDVQFLKCGLKHSLDFNSLLEVWEFWKHLMLFAFKKIAFLYWLFLLYIIFSQVPFNNS